MTPVGRKTLVEQLRKMKREDEDAYGLLGNTRANALTEAADLLEHDAAVLEGLESEAAIEVVMRFVHPVLGNSAGVRAIRRTNAESALKGARAAALQHAQEQVGGEQ